MHRRMVAAWILGLATASSLLAQAPESTPTAEELRPVVEKGYAYLKAHQDADGSFSKQRSGPGVTALVVAALIKNGYPASDPVVAKALKFMEGSVQPDGGIYNQRLANYTTSAAMMALKEANSDGRYDAILKKAAEFLKTVQADEQRGYDFGKAEYGGAGYDGKSRPDLSNTNFFVEALQAAGVPKDDPAMKRALVFVSRCQNLPSEHNNLEFAKKVSADDRGGFIYTPVNGGESGAGKTDDGGLRSQGVMTYSGLKSFLYAGVAKDDPRVKAAIDWIRKHYTTKENPGQGKTGLFYYYHVFAKAMDALGEGDQFTDAAGAKHNWKHDLFETLKGSQAADGSWNNAADRFMEGDPNLCTAFGLLSLGYCKQK